MPMEIRTIDLFSIVIPIRRKDMWVIVLAAINLFYLVLFFFIRGVGLNDN